MTAPLNSKADSPASSGSGAKDGFYLQPRTKIWILGFCLTVMIGASVYAVLQPLNPDPSDPSLSDRFWYPHETNPLARLQAVRCADDYACRLNSVAVNGTGDLPEVWAVGNVGLVLHRSAGQSRWEQLAITAKEEILSPAPAPGPTPKPVRPISTATPQPTPVVTPTPQRVVPYLIGLGEEEARKTAIFSGFKMQVEYESGSAPSPVQQGPPVDLKVIRQSPDPKTLAPSNSTIRVTLGRTPRSKASLLLDRFLPRVYAAEPERKPHQQQNPSRTNLQGKPAAQSNPSPGSSVQAKSQPSLLSKLDDDLIYVSCSNKHCRSLGRSGRVYTVDNNDWSFRQAIFKGSNGDLIPSLSLQYATSEYATKNSTIGVGSVIARSEDTSFICSTKQPLEALDTNPTFVCSPSSSLPPTVITSDLTVGSRHGDTTAALRSFAFAGNNHAFIVGDHGIIVSTTNGPNAWRHETQGPEGAAPNHRFPAPWYWVLAGLLIITCSAVVAIPAPPPVTELSVADWTVTDAPLKPGDVDSLGFTPMALGLSRFIRNPKTQPPVTIAIEGEWGEGKSSVMSLLRGDLEKSRFRPVWFNAWHHQSEEQLLAALLEHIKSQAVPPWWHIDNWIFRARLVYFRFRGKWPLLIVLLLGLCGVVSFEFSRHGLKLDDFVKFGTDVIKLVKYLLPWSSQKELPDDLGHFSLVATVIAIFATIFKKAQAFGINPAKLSDNLRDAATIKDIKPDPGARPRFAREFGDVCKAWSWGGRRVIIFIDDLDRCRPESVVTVLESINFLTTAGDCMVVLGMAEKQVTHCVGLGFKDIAHAEAAYLGGGNTEQEKAIARFNYGTLYIKKLVNIVAPLPKTTPEQRRRVLEARAAEVRRQEDEEQKASPAAWRTALWDWASQAAGMTFKAAPVLALLLAVGLSAFIGYKQGIQQKPPEKPLQPVTKPVPPQPAPNPLPIADKVNGVARPLIYNRPATQPAILVEPDKSAGAVWWSYAADAFFLLLLFGILAYQLSARTNQDAQNSPEFEESLKLWGRYIVGVCDTPREIKRALNDLRYQAMTRRSNGPSTTRGERLIRAVRQFVTGQAEKTSIDTRVDEAALPPRKAAELATLTDDELKAFLDPDKLDMKGSENLQRLIELKREHMRRFQRWIGEVEPVTEPLAGAPENPPPARAAHQA